MVDKKNYVKNRNDPTKQRSNDRKNNPPQQMQRKSMILKILRYTQQEWSSKHGCSTYIKQGNDIEILSLQENNEAQYKTFH